MQENDGKDIDQQQKDASQEQNVIMEQ